MGGQVAIDMPECDMDAPFGAPAPWDEDSAPNGQDYMLYVWIGLGALVVIILLTCWFCCGKSESSSRGSFLSGLNPFAKKEPESFLSKLNPFAKKEPEGCCSKPAVKYGVPALALAAAAVGGVMYYKKGQADAAARKKEEEDGEFAVKVWTVSGVAGLVALGAIWWKRATVIYWFKWLGHKCRILKTAPTKPAAGADNLCKICENDMAESGETSSPYRCACKFHKTCVAEATSCPVCKENPK